jgi:hypothetical protein
MWCATTEGVSKKSHKTLNDIATCPSPWMASFRGVRRETQHTEFQVFRLSVSRPLGFRHAATNQADKGSLKTAGLPSSGFQVFRFSGFQVFRFSLLPHLRVLPHEVTRQG